MGGADLHLVDLHLNDFYVNSDKGLNGFQTLPRLLRKSKIKSENVEIFPSDKVKIFLKSFLMLNHANQLNVGNFWSQTP